MLLPLDMVANPLGAYQPNPGPNGALDGEIALETDSTMYVANAGGTQRLDPDQVSFGRLGIQIANPWGARRPSQGPSETLVGTNQTKDGKNAETLGISVASSPSSARTGSGLGGSWVISSRNVGGYPTGDAPTPRVDLVQVIF